jgi:hypothetical protein
VKTSSGSRVSAVVRGPTARPIVRAVSGRIDAAIDRLDEALRAAGVAALAASTDGEALVEIGEAVAPYRLPGDLHRFWERVGFRDSSVSGWRLPEPLDARLALDTHRANLEPDVVYLFGPPLLFPIARISGDQWSVELVSEWSEGGTVFSHELEHRVEYPSLADLVEVYAELLEEGAFELRAGRAGLLLEPERAKQERRIGAAWPHPLYGDAREISADPLGWPAHWLAAAGIDLASRTPRGATHTIAEAVAAAETGELVARVVGKVVWLGGSSAGVLAVVDDGTTQLDVWCPAGTSRWGPTMGVTFEFELTMRNAVPPSDLRTRELLGFLEDVGREGPAALALDVRPVDR